MAKLRSFRETRTLGATESEQRLFRLRVAAALGAVGATMLVLLFRLFQLQVLDHAHYSTWSQENRIAVVPVAPPRGLIRDRTGIVLAENRPTFTLELVPEAVGDLERTLRDLKALVGVSERDEASFRRILSRSPPFRSVPLRAGLEEDEVARLAVNRHRLPGVEVHARLTRHYPFGPLAAHVVGYVGRIDESDEARIDRRHYAATTHVGKVGVERSYERPLHGLPGHERVEVDAHGRVVRNLGHEDPVPGADLYLTLDLPLQAVAERAIGEATGAVVALDPRSGAIRAMASRPSFDPNPFVAGLEPDAYQALVDSAERPLFNRALAGQYPPASTIKPFLALAALDSGAEIVHRSIWDPGYFEFGGRRYRNWKRGGHGFVDLAGAIAQSCDTYFYQLALELGIERMHEYLTRFGFGARTGVDLIGEAEGLVPSPAWKRAARGEPWSPGETVITGIGQGYLLSTPLQLAAATAAVAMRGVRFAPRIVGRVVAGSRDESLVAPQPLSPVELRHEDAWATVTSAMAEVVHGAAGTARRIGESAPVRIAGKTGTAQVRALERTEGEPPAASDRRLVDHALFVAFAPAEDPMIAVAVVVEHGGSGSGAAAPIARQVIDAHLARLGVSENGNGSAGRPHEAGKRAPRSWSTSSQTLMSGR